MFPKEMKVWKFHVHQIRVVCVSVLNKRLRLFCSSSLVFGRNTSSMNAVISLYMCVSYRFVQHCSYYAIDKMMK